MVSQREKEYGAEETERIPLLPGAQSGDIEMGEGAQTYEENVHK